MANKPKSPAQVAAARKVAVEQQKVNAQKNKAKVAANKSKVSANASKVQSNAAKMKTVTGSAVKVTAPKPGMKTVTSKDVTVTAKKPTSKPNEGGIYLVKKDGKNVQVTKQEYDATKGPNKDKMQRDASGYIVQKGSGGSRVKIDYQPLKGWSKW